MDEQLLKPSEVAEKLNLNIQTIYRRAKRNELPHIKIGKSLRFKASEIEEYINQGHQKKLSDDTQQTVS